MRRLIISYRIRLLAWKNTYPRAFATSCSDSVHAAKPIPMHELRPGKLHFHWTYLALQTRRQHFGLRRRPRMSHLQLQLDLHLHPRDLVLQTQVSVGDGGIPLELHHLLSPGMAFSSVASGHFVQLGREILHYPKAPELGLDLTPLPSA